MRKLFSVLLMLVFIMPLIFAAEQKQFSSEMKAILINKIWTCDWKSHSFPGTLFGQYKIDIKSISETSISGEFENTFCRGVLNFEGKVEGNEFSWKIGQIDGICKGLSVKLKATENKRNEANLVGNYNGRYKRFVDSGRVTCN